MTNGRRGSATHDMPPEDPIAAEKKRVRQRAMEQRRRARAKFGSAAALRLRDRFLAEIAIPPNAVVAGFAPIGDEIDVLPLLSALSGRGHPCALPVVSGRGRPLLFRAWTPGMALIEAQFGVGVPPPTSPQLRPSVVLVPLLAFDGAGQRIGYGAGFYDRTLQALRRDGEVLAIGVAFADQQITTVPVDGTDARLDLVATERFVTDFRTES